MLRSIALDSLNKKSYNVQGYVDDLVVVIRDKYDLMQNVLHYIQQWCTRKGLNLRNAVLSNVQTNAEV